MTETNWIHDEDSFNPNEIYDEERELTEDEEYMQDLICETVYKLEDVAEEAADKHSDTITISREVAMQAVQLIKAYSTLYDLSREDYETEYE